MDPVILMVGRVNEGVHDLEVMPDVPAAELADAIALAFGWPGAYDIQVGGKLLASGQTLADAGVWDGAQLTLVASSRPTRSVSGVNRPLQTSPIASRAEGPVAGHRPLQAPASVGGSPAGTDDTSAPSPVKGWRQPPDNPSRDLNQKD